MIPLFIFSFPTFSHSDCISLILKLPSLTLHRTVIYSCHLLDLIVTTLSSTRIGCIYPNSFQQIELLTDYFIVEFFINHKFTNIKRKLITYRDFMSIDLPSFFNQYQNCDLFSYFPLSIGTFATSQLSSVSMTQSCLP